MFSNHNLLKIIFIFFIILVHSLSAKPKTPPNFIIFYVDDLGWADTSVRMDKNVEESRSYFYQTPALEKLAKQGVVFSNAYSPAPTCTPSRISINYGMTNARLQYTTVHDVAAKNRGRNKSIPKEHTSIPQMLKQANLGYVTAHFGKGIAIAKPQEIGYDEHDCFDIGDNGNYHGDYVKIAPVGEREPLPADDPKRMYSLTDTSVNFINRQAKTKKPFFMFVSHYSAHVPHAASAHMIEKYRKLPRGKYCTDADYMNPKDMTEGFRTCSWRLQYAALVEETDMSLGRIMKALEKHGLDKNTYVIFTSDNGGGLPPNGILNGGKSNLSEGGIRVPTVIAGPRMPAGKQCDTPIIQWDFFSTIHDLSGSTYSLPNNIDGGSLKNIFFNPENGTVKRPVPGLIFNYPYYAAAPINAIRIGDYKLMHQLNTNEMRLYNVNTDLEEKNNLAESMPDKVKEMSTVLNTYLKKVDAIQIDEVYTAREEELLYYMERSKVNYDNRLKRSLQKAPKSKHSEIQQKELKRYDKRIKDLKGQLEHLKMQMRNKKFLGGHYKEDEENYKGN